MTPLFLVLIFGFALHMVVATYTHTPDARRAPKRWEYGHEFLAGLATTAVLVAAAIALYTVTGVSLPVWALILTADLLTAACRLWRHRQRVLERRTLQGLFDRPAHGEG